MCALLLACTESIILTINQNLFFFTPLCALIPQRGGTHPFKKNSDLRQSTWCAPPPANHLDIARPHTVNKLSAAIFHLKNQKK